MASLKAMAKEAKSKKNASVPKKEPKKAPEPIYKSAEFIEESDDGDKYSDEESDDEEDELPALSVDRKAKTNGAYVAPDGSSSESESESESESGGTEESRSSHDEEKETVTLEPMKKPAKEPANRTVSFGPAPYKPPTGFEQGKLHGGSKATELFKKSNLEGKQIWYFTAPASVPVSAIESITLLGVKNGEPVLKHLNSEYGFMQDSIEDKTYTKIMVPNISDDSYRITPGSIDQILHLQQIVNLPGVHEGITSTQDSASKATVPFKRPARPQPKGLKMRFRPLGFGSGEVGNIGSSSESGSDVEMDAAPAANVRNSEVKSTPKSEKHISDAPLKKRKHNEDETKKSKKSSSSTTENPNDKKLKGMKKKQIDPQTDTTDKLSASTSALASSTHSHQRDTSMPLPKPLKYSQASDVNSDSYPNQSSQKLGSRKRERSLAGTTDAGLTGEEEKRKAKKLKKTKREVHSSS